MFSDEDIKTIQTKGVIYKKEKEIGKDYYLENRNKDYSTLISKLGVPVLIVHGTLDEDVPIRYSQKLAERYGNVTFKPLRGADHKVKDKFLQEKLVNLTSQWLKKHFSPKGQVSGGLKC